jgi:hypothetical protein
MAPAASEQRSPPAPDQLARRVFCALFGDFDLVTVHGIYVAVPRDTPCFAGRTLSEVAQQISQQEHLGPAAVPSAPASPRRGDMTPSPIRSGRAGHEVPPVPAVRGAGLPSGVLSGNPLTAASREENDGSTERPAVRAQRTPG